MNESLKVRKVTPGDRSEYLRMRCNLYPEDHAGLIEQELEEVLQADPVQEMCFVLERPTGELGGFLEMSVHSATAKGEIERIAYIGSWYVDPDLRRRGFGSALLREGEQWARDVGCAEVRSDCYETNLVSYQAHLRNGFHETHRQIFFAKAL